MGNQNLKQEEEDYEFAMQSIRTLSQELRKTFGNGFRGMSIWGSLKDHFFMRPVEISKLNANQVQALREADIPISGETKGSDIDATVYIDKEIIMAVGLFLSECIDEYNETLRFEHVLIVPFEEIMPFFQKLKEIFQKGKYLTRIDQKIRCLFAICKETQQETGTFCKDRINETLVVETLGRIYFEDAFLGIRYHMVNSLEKILELDPPSKVYLADIREHALQLDATYYPKYLRKKNRFIRYEQILKDVSK